MQLYNVIIKPILSEKSTDMRELHNKYAFEVAKEATKEEIAKAVTLMWGAKVEKVTTSLRRTKIKRRGAVLSKPKLQKRAFITLAEGQKLPLFEDQ
jgi:large subunit ribosomal protein L23